MTLAISKINLIQSSRKENIFLFAYKFCCFFGCAMPWWWCRREEMNIKFKVKVFALKLLIKFCLYFFCWLKILNILFKFCKLTWDCSLLHEISYSKNNHHRLSSNYYLQFLQQIKVMTFDILKNRRLLTSSLVVSFIKQQFNFISLLSKNISQ